MKDYRSNRDVERIRELLANAAPASPDPTGRADAVARRGRRARVRRGAAGAVVVALAAAVVVAGPHFLKSSPTTNAATDPANGVTSPVGGNLATVDPFADPCPKRPIRLRAIHSPRTLLATGAVGIRLCRAAEGGHQSPWTAPADALVTNVDGFVGYVNSASEPAQASCASKSSGGPFLLSVHYPGGRTVPLSGSTSGCSASVRLGGRDISADGMLAEFRQALRSQRDSAEPYTRPTAPECRFERTRTPWMVSADTLDLAAASVCAKPTRSGRRQHAPSSGVLSDEQIRTLQADFARNSTTRRQVTTCIQPGPATAIVGVTAWGDRISLEEDLCAGEFSGLGHFWVPGTASRAVLASVLHSQS